MARLSSKTVRKTEPGTPSNLNLPNFLTGLRILLAPALVLLLADEDRLRDSLALGTLGVAALTDFLDGYVARKQGKVTRMGQFLDPLADKICISAAFVMLALKGRIWSWVPEVIIGREVIITLFRIYAGSRGSSVPASVLGKLKTNSQLLALFLVLLHGEPDWYDVLEKSAMALAVALTLYSGYDYISKAGRYLPRRGEQDA